MGIAVALKVWLRVVFFGVLSGSLLAGTGGGVAHASDAPISLHVATFDSGFGGYLTAKSIEQASLPLLRDYSVDITIHHYGDTKNLPYGEKTPEQIAALGSAGVLKAFKEGADMVFIACNTASTQYQRIRQAVDTTYPGEARPVISIIDVSTREAKLRIDAALTTQKSAVFVILATPATVKSMVYPRQLAALYGVPLEEQPAHQYVQPRWFKAAGDSVQSLTQKSVMRLAGHVVEVYQLAPANWVEMIEHGADIKTQHDAIRRDLKLLHSEQGYGATPNVVGYFCTHYPILDKTIRAEMLPSRGTGSAITSYISQGQLMASVFKDMAGKKLSGHQRLTPISSIEMAQLQAQAQASITISGKNGDNTRMLARTLFPADPAPSVEEADMGSVPAEVASSGSKETDTGVKALLGANERVSSVKEDMLWEHLRASISEVEQHLSGVLGVAIMDLSTGHELLVHPDEVFPQASSIKIAVLAELYHQDGGSVSGKLGKARLSDSYTVRSSDLVADSDIMGGLTPGVTKLTNRDLATMMVAVSDNSATNVLIDRIGMDNVQRLMDSLGLKDTRLRRKMMDLKAAAQGRENISTPREMMHLLEAVYRHKVFAASSGDDFFNVLATHKDSWLPRDLPSEIRIANKPGALEGVRADSGVVFIANRPYIICVMTSYLAQERAGEDAISRISAETYSLFDLLARASSYGRIISPRNGR